MNNLKSMSQSDIQSGVRCLSWHTGIWQVSTNQSRFIMSVCCY